MRTKPAVCLIVGALLLLPGASVAQSAGPSPAEASLFAASAQPEWLQAAGLTGPRQRWGHALAYDNARQRVVLFGGMDETGTVRNDTWEWDGNRWLLQFPLRTPPPRSAHAMVYDEARGVVVLYGGCSNLSCAYPRGDMWTWDGTDWTELHPPALPDPNRQGHSMAYDPSRGEIVLYGGYNQIALFDTVVWNGTTWINRTPAVGPGGRYSAAMAYDASSHKVILFGGLDSTLQRRNDTWEWDGATARWTQRHPATNPTPRELHAMAGTPSGILLHGGYPGYHETYAWDGQDWHLLGAASTPAPDSVAMAYDRARNVAVVFGGGLTRTPYQRVFDDTWEWDGHDWTNRRAPGLSAGVGYWRPAVAYSAALQRVLLFTGFIESSSTYTGDVWTWDGATWEVRTSAGIPGARHGGLAFDEDRNRWVLFGGVNGNVYLNNTWEWDGIDWTLRLPATNPGGRTGHAMTYVPAMHRTILVGGMNGNDGLKRDTWTWDGTAWTQLPGGALTNRYDHAIAYDARRARLVLFGGCVSYYCTGGRLADTWEWDGNLWTLRSPAQSPSARSGHAMDYDEARGRVVLHGGVAQNGSLLNDTWEWDGTNWSRIEPPQLPSPGSSVAMAYDRQRSRTVLFQTTPGSAGSSTEVWEYGAFEDCSHATAVESFQPGAGTPSASAEAALSAPDGNAASLGLNGSLVLRIGPVVDSSGTDLVVHERGAGDGEFDDRFLVELSADGANFARAAICSGGRCAVDLYPAGVSAASFIRLTDLTSAGSPDSGADIDAVSVVGCAHEVCDGQDDDGDGLIDEGCDDDGDGYCEAGLVVIGTPPVCPAGGGDCDDANPSVHPGAAEVPCNGVDDDCDGVSIGGADSDHDGLPALCDNCPDVFNPTQADADGDSLGDACDNCVAAWNPAQQDWDHDQSGDACDNCPLAPNSQQEDFERDGVGDACDNCPYDQNRSQADVDGDHVGDVCDLDDGVIMLFRTEAGFIEWQAESQYASFNVYEGDLSELRSTGTYTQIPGSNPLAQRTCGVLVPYIEDTDSPAAGGVQFSLVTGVTNGIEGTLGSSTVLAARPNANPCP